jgi:hypothetical protein
MVQVLIPSFLHLFRCAHLHNCGGETPLPKEGRGHGTEFSNPQLNPQRLMSCTTYAYFGSLRVFVSCCKT